MSIFDLIDKGDLKGIVYNIDRDNLTQKNDKLETPIEYAARKKLWNCVNVIAKNCNSFSGAGYHLALNSAIKEKEIDTIKILLEASTPIDIKDNKGYTPIEIAVKLEAWNIVNIIVDKRNDDDGQACFGSALVDAVEKNKLKIATDLLEGKASLTWSNNKNYPLHYAVINKNKEMVRVLLKYANKENLSAKNSQNQTPIELASQMGEWDIVKMLYKKTKNYGSNFYKNAHYEKVLINAVKQSDYYYVNLLLQDKIPCNKPNNEMGNIALYWAIKNNKPGIVQLLLDHGANPDIRNKDEDSSYEIAFKNSMPCYNVLTQYKNRKLLKEKIIAEKKEKALVFLNGLIEELSKKWLIQNIWGVYVKGTPKHFEKLQFCLTEGKTNSIEAMLKTCNKLISILNKIEENDRRHLTTTDFYNNTKNQLMLLTANLKMPIDAEVDKLLSAQINTIIKETVKIDHSNLLATVIPPLPTLYPQLNANVGFFQAATFKEELVKTQPEYSSIVDSLKPIYTVKPTLEINETGTINHCFPTVPNHSPVLFSDSSNKVNIESLPELNEPLNIRRIAEPA